MCIACAWRQKADETERKSGIIWHLGDHDAKFQWGDRAIKSSTPHGARALSRWCLGGKKKEEKKESESDRGSG